MDTITHFALGACMGELMAGKQLGRRALIVGGAAQLIPDSDFAFGLFLSPASNVLAHRGITHSIFFLMVTSLFLSFIMHRGWRSRQHPLMFWWRIFAVEMFVHLLLDSLNAYGTGLLEPFSHIRVSLNTLFVADPFFSIPAGVGLVLLLFWRQGTSRRAIIASACIALCCLYICYAVVNKTLVTRVVSRVLANDQLSGAQIIITPTPFNSWLWYVVATTTAGSYVGYRSVFDQSPMTFEFFPRNEVLMGHRASSDEVGKLIRFSQGHYTLEQHADTLIFNDLRFGQMIGWQYPRAGFVFHYYLSPDIDNHLVLQRGRFSSWDVEATRSFIHRMFGDRHSEPGIHPPG